MIPNIFISSTISDLHYLRDALHDSVEDLAYHPVMSEYGEVGYLNPSTAAESCYRSVRQCQMVVLIIGKRYGSVGEDGLSITHREYRASKESKIPTITLVESHVLNYKEVFDTDPEADMWNTFSQMDRAKSTFLFLKEVSESETYNAVVPFNSVADAQNKLKLQIADFVGDRLVGSVPQMDQNLREVLAEIKTLRNQLSHSSPEFEARELESKRYLIIARFLLSNKNDVYRNLLEFLFENADIITEKIGECETFGDVLSNANYSYEIVESRDEIISLVQNQPKEKSKKMIMNTHLSDGIFVVYADKRMVLTKGAYDYLNGRQQELFTKLTASNIE